MLFYAGELAAVQQHISGATTLEVGKMGVKTSIPHPFSDIAGDKTR